MYAKDLVGDLTKHSEFVKVNHKVKNPVLNVGQSKFIHDNCEVSDAYNYNTAEPETRLLPNNILVVDTTQQEVKLLVVRTPAEKAQIGKLGKELKSLRTNDNKRVINVILGFARLWYSDNSSYYQTKKALKNAIKVEKSIIERNLAIASLIDG